MKSSRDDVCTSRTDKVAVLAIITVVLLGPHTY